jgi:hypothetical protein
MLQNLAEYVLTSSTINNFLTIDVGSCTRGSSTTEQNDLFNNRNNVEDDEIVVYFVRSTNPPHNSCASHPTGRPGAVVVRSASEWTLAHEVGHVLGLNHVDSSGDRLYDRWMTDYGKETTERSTCDAQITLALHFCP